MGFFQRSVHQVVPQQFVLAPRSYQSLRDYVDRSSRVTARWEGTVPVDVFFVNDQGLQAMVAGEPFEYFGRRGMSRGVQLFQPPSDDFWNLVIANPSDTEIADVTVWAARQG